MASETLPPLTHVLETILYVKSMEQSSEFYTSVLGLKAVASSPRGTIFNLGNTTLLLFQLGLTCEDMVDDPSNPSFCIPKHGPSGPVLETLLQSGAQLKQHFCLAVDSRRDVECWEAYLGEKGVKMLGKMNWERGGYSVYFADPDGHVGEIGSRGIWPHY